MKNIQKITEQDLSREFSGVFVALTPVDSGASSKILFRISGELPGRWSQNTLILMWMGGDPPLMYEYQNINKFLVKNNIRVPKIFFEGRSGNYLIMEDGGDLTLETAMKAGGGEPETLYRSALDLLLSIQTLRPAPDCIASQRYFNLEKFMHELAFHVKEHLISKYFHSPLSGKDEAMLTADYEHLARTLSSQTMVFVHRDYQSSNLLVHNGSLTVTDFQDARMGLPFYDLVSLLEDSYVTLSEGQKDTLIQYYRSRADGSVIPESSLSQFQQIYDWTVIQRKLHDAGAFAFCYQNIGNRKYLPYISTAVRQALRRMSRYDVFSRTYALLSSILENEETF